MPFKRLCTSTDFWNEMQVSWLLCIASLMVFMNTPTSYEHHFICLNAIFDTLHRKGISFVCTSVLTAGRTWISVKYVAKSILFDSSSHYACFAIERVPLCWKSRLLQPINGIAFDNVLEYHALHRYGGVYWSANTKEAYFAILRLLGALQVLYMSGKIVVRKEEHLVPSFLTQRLATAFLGFRKPWFVTNIVLQDRDSRLSCI